MKYELERTWVQFKSQLSDLLPRTVLSTYGPPMGSQGESSFIFTSAAPVQCLAHKRCLNVA